MSAVTRDENDEKKNCIASLRILLFNLNSASDIVRFNFGGLLMALTMMAAYQNLHQTVGVI